MKFLLIAGLIVTLNFVPSCKRETDRIGEPSPTREKKAESVAVHPKTAPVQSKESRQSGSKGKSDEVQKEHEVKNSSAILTQEQLTKLNQRMSFAMKKNEQLLDLE